MKWGNHHDGARWIRITGQPEIPSELNIAARNDLIGWTATLYLDPMGNDENSGKPGSKPMVKLWAGNSTHRRDENTKVCCAFIIVRYKKDSVVSYDFFYIPNQSHVHPALGRMSFLLDPDGVKLHWLTDAQWDRSGLEPDNAIVEKSSQIGPASLPLKNDDWNHIKK